MTCLLPRPLALFLAVLSLAVSVAAQNSGLPADFVGLVPEDAVLLVELRSADELARESEGYRAVSKPELDPVTGTAVLAYFASELDVPGDPAALDPSLPAGFALRVVGGELVPTFIVPTRDAAAWTKSTEGSAEKLSFATAGKYVACTFGELPPAAATPSRLAAAWPATLFAVRVDASRLIAAYRLQIDALLGQVEQMIEAGAFESEEMPFDMTEMLDQYVQFANDLVASADVVELSSDVQRGEYVFVGSLSIKTGTPLTKYAHAERVDYAALARQVERGAALQVLGSYDQTSVWQSSEQFYGAVFAALEANPETPKGLVPALRAAFQHTGEVMAQSGRTIAYSADVDARGVRMASVFTPPNAAGIDALAGAWGGIFADPAFATLGLSSDPVERTKLAGLPAELRALAFDLKKFVAAFPDAAPGAGLGADGESTAMLRELTRRLLGGERLRWCSVTTGERIAVLVGGDDAWRTTAAQRLAAGAEPSPALAKLAATLDGANPAYAAHIDFGRLLAGVVAIGEGTALAAQDSDDTLGVLRAFGAKPMPVSLHWAVTPSVWRAGASIGRDGVAHFVECALAIERETERRARAEQDVSAIVLGLIHFAVEHDGAYPAKLAELETPDAEREAYVDVSLIDPWGRAYEYELSPDGSQFIVRTLGADGKQGGRGADSDFSSEQLPPPEGFEPEWTDDEEMDGDEGEEDDGGEE
ncbi:MAG: type II secretion system protein GspG [Planctomycetes bacterium]|nr:type II secretion system protein GspG [Planctomycetota bacterium]